MKQTTINEIKKMLEEYENNELIKFVKEIDEDGELNRYARENLRIAIRCVASFMMNEYLENNSIVEAKDAIEKIFPPLLNY